MKISLAFFTLFVASMAWAVTQGPKQVSVALRSGGAPKVVQGRIDGQSMTEFKIPVKAGQVLAANLKSSNAGVGFLVMSPGSEEASASSELSSRSVKATMPDDGTAVVRVFLNRAAARRGEKANFSISLSLAGKALRPVASDALVKGSRYHATAEAEASLSLDKSVKSCKVGVIRRGTDGTGTIVFGTGSRRRTVLFVRGTAIANDSLQAVTSKESDEVITVTVGGDDETYRFNRALLFGG